MIRASIEPTFEAFREKARALASRDVLPSEVLWEDATRGQATLFDGGGPTADDAPAARAVRVPAEYVRLAEKVAYHRDPERFARLYRALFRLTHGEPHLLDLAADPDVARLRTMERAARHEEHEMHAFVRFRRVVSAEGERFIAWYRPEHPVLRLAAPFFARRFASMRWTILTPDLSAGWDGEELRYGPGAPRESAPGEDELEDLFRAYYGAIFNPARASLETMRARLPRKRWDLLPETSIVKDLLRGAQDRVSVMRTPEPSASASFVPEARSLPVLREAAAGCRACGLCEHATQTVFGEGPANAELMLVGEQPGNDEDLAGRPFIGPAGRLLDEALAAAGVERARVYLTNAVKHFKFEPRGKRRLHSKPNHVEVLACRAWLDAEIETVKPKVIVALGATAGQSFLGRRFALGRVRGQTLATPWAPAWLATWHPSAALRAVDDAARAGIEDALRADLSRAAELLRASPRELAQNVQTRP